MEDNDRFAQSEEREATSEESDVEGHGMSNKPTSESPTSEATSEEPDFEAHGLTERPVTE